MAVVRRLSAVRQPADADSPDIGREALAGGLGPLASTVATVGEKPMVSAKLLIDGLTKRYGDTLALEPTHLAVSPGEFLTLLGPSGSGKTTLLHMISGLVEPSGGRILIDGVDRTTTPVHNRDIGLVFQNYALFPHLTVAENIAFPLRMRKLPPEVIDQRVYEALSMVKLAHLPHRFPRELSGGQQQRIALARCFVYQPSIILMDEPLGSLDKKLREHMQLEIKRLHRESRATIIYVTHDQEEALALSDRICLLSNAKIEQIGKPDEVYARPRTEFAADFIGISNIFRGCVRRVDDGAFVLATKEGTFHVAAQASFTDGVEAGLVVRPEHLSINGSGGNHVTGRVLETVYAGSETRVLIGLSDGSTVICRVSKGMPPPPHIGEAVSLHWVSEAGVLVP